MRERRGFMHNELYSLSEIYEQALISKQRKVFQLEVRLIFKKKIEFLQQEPFNLLTLLYAVSK